jgi:hypothetical protein
MASLRRYLHVAARNVNRMRFDGKCWEAAGGASI